MTKSEMKQDEIRIGIYGFTKAGKTRFLFKLLSDWEGSGFICDLSDGCKDFLRVNREFLKSSKVLPATTAFTDISFVLKKFGINDKSLAFFIQDLRGEELAKEIKNDFPENGFMAKQVKSCNGFLVLFDPSNSEDAGTEIDSHYKRELVRTDEFIEYVLDQRQNHFLPIVFVLTHFDVWKKNETILVKVAEWKNQIITTMKSSFSVLDGHYPLSIVEEQNIFTEISSVQKPPVHFVIEQIIQLVDECKKFKEKDRIGKRMWILQAGIFISILFVFFVFAIFWSASEKQKQKIAFIRSIAETKELLKELPISKMNEKNVADLNKHLINLLFEYYKNSFLLDVKEVAKLKSVVQEIFIRITDISRIASEGDLERQLLLLKGLISGLGQFAKDSKSEDGFSIGKIFDDYWEIKKVIIQKKIASIIFDNNKIPNGEFGKALKTWKEINDEFIDFHKEILTDQNNMPSKKAKTLGKEMQSSKQFSENIINLKNYNIKFKVLEASSKMNEELIVFNFKHQLSEKGNEKKDFNISEDYGLYREKNYKTKADFYELGLPLGTPLKIGIMALKNPSDPWIDFGDVELFSGPKDAFRSLGLPFVSKEEKKIFEIKKNFNNSEFSMKLEIWFNYEFPKFIFDCEMFVQKSFLIENQKQ